MTPKAQRIAIAEACGWTCKSSKSQIIGIVATQWFFPDGNPAHPHEVSGDAIGYLPDYLNDLNEMREAEERLNNSKDGYQFGIELARLVMNIRQPSGFFATDDNLCLNPWAASRLAWATAAQRAEAFLRTLNLWKD